MFCSKNSQKLSLADVAHELILKAAAAVMKCCFAKYCNTIWKNVLCTHKMIVNVLNLLHGFKKNLAILRTKKNTLEYAW